VHGCTPREVAVLQEFDREVAEWAWTQVDGHRSRHHVRRKHLKERGILDRRYRRLQQSDYRVDDFGKWLNDLWVFVDELNFLIETPPSQSGIRRDRRLTWKELFGAHKDFPDAPVGANDRPGMDAGSSGLGVAWNRPGITAYEQQLESAKAKYVGLGDASRTRQVIEKLASLNEATEDWEQATQHLHELRSLNVEFKDDVFVADCWLRLGIAYYRLGRWPQAEEVIDQGLAVVHRRADLLSRSKTELRLLGYCGLVRLRQNRPEEALRIFDELVQPLVERHRSTYVSATFHHRRGLILTSLGRYEVAHADIEKALWLRMECRAEFEVTRTLFYLGRLCARQNWWRSAISIWTVCEERHRRFEDRLGIARVMLELGHAYEHLSRDAAGDDEVICDVYEASLSERELEAVLRLARGFHANVEDGLRSVISGKALPSLAQRAYEAALYWADLAGVAKIRDDAQHGLQRRGRRTAQPAARPSAAGS